MPEQPNDGEAQVAGGLRARQNRYRQARQARTPPPPQHPRGTGIPPAPQPVTPAAPGSAEAPRTAETPDDLAVPVGIVAPNPLNTRDLGRQAASIMKLANSLKERGQIEPCAVVTNAAFVALFPEHASAVGSTKYVQVAGGRRRAAVLLAGLPTIDVVVKDGLAISRLGFLEATAAENLDRDDLDPIEEAEALELLVQEADSANEVAQRMNRTKGWLSQRRALLKLIPDVREAMRVEEAERRLPLREVRDWHGKAAAEQLALLERWRRKSGLFTAVNPGEDADPAVPTQRQRLSAAASAWRRLGGNPVTVAEKLRAELTAEERHQLAAELLREEPHHP